MEPTMDLTILGDMLREDGSISPGCLEIREGQISSLSSMDESSIPSTRVLRAPPNGVIAPGFIDIQLNGAFGHDFTADRTGLLEVARRLPRYGVTSFLPTVITSPLSNFRRAVSDAAPFMEDSKGRGAEILGLHFEGPYLTPSKGGAHNRSYMIAPSIEHLEIFDPKVVRMVTLAPELPGCLDFISELAGTGVVVGMGHSEASYQTAIEAADSGASSGTHLFNRMPPLTHQEPGLVGALLTDPRLSFGLIADCLHTHPAILQLAYAAKGPQQITLVSDAISATAMPPGDYLLGDIPIVVDGESSRTKDAGRLAGSILTLDRAVRNMIAHTNCGLANALTMASATAAQLLRLTNKGKLAPGLDADIVLLDEAGFVVTTIARGNIVYDSTWSTN
jgi:N-acetylglucosamine-6-phosphate deacetylase